MKTYGITVTYGVQANRRVGGQAQGTRAHDHGLRGHSRLRAWKSASCLMRGTIHDEDVEKDLTANP